MSSKAIFFIGIDVSKCNKTNDRILTWHQRINCEISYPSLDSGNNFFVCVNWGLMGMSLYLQEEKKNKKN